MNRRAPAPTRRPGSTGEGRSPVPAPSPLQGAAPPARGHSLAALRVTPPQGAPIQLGKKLTPSQRLALLAQKGLVAAVDRNDPGGVKTVPKTPGNYGLVHPYQGRSYHVRKDADKRVTKIAGPLAYTTSKRVATKRTAYKRRRDVNFHLLAHFAGGPSDLQENYVAVDRLINSAGGDWGRIETYLRQRLRQQRIKAYGSVKPVFAGKPKRPSAIGATFRFNTSPYKVKFNVGTP